MLRLLDIQDDSKSAFQLGIIDSPKLLPEQCLSSSTVRLQNSLAQLRTRSSCDPVDFIRDRERAESIGIVVRQGKAQNCQVPDHKVLACHSVGPC